MSCAISWALWWSPGWRGWRRRWGTRRGPKILGRRQGRASNWDFRVFAKNCLHHYYCWSFNKYKRFCRRRSQGAMITILASLDNNHSVSHSPTNITSRSLCGVKHILAGFLDMGCEILSEISIHPVPQARISLFVVWLSGRVPITLISGLCDAKMVFCIWDMFCCWKMVARLPTYIIVRYVDMYFSSKHLRGGWLFPSIWVSAPQLVEWSPCFGDVLASRRLLQMSTYNYQEQNI